MDPFHPKPDEDNFVVSDWTAGDWAGSATQSVSAGRAEPITLKRVREVMKDKFRAMPLSQTYARLIALLFARPALDLFKNQILPNITYWHYRSETSLDFFCPGYSSWRNGFSLQAFIAVLKHFERETKWEYSGGTDLVILSVVGSRSGDLRFNYRSAVAVPLEVAAAAGAVESVPIFFETLIRLSAQHAPDGAKAYSNGVAKQLSISAIKGLLLSAVPEGMRKDAAKAFFFRTKDISRSHDEDQLP